MSARRRLKHARKVRHRIAHVFSELASGATTLYIVLERPPACLTHVRVYDVLRRSKGLGPQGAEKVLKRAEVWPLRTVGELTPDECKSLIASLPPRVPRYPEKRAA